MNHPSRKLLSLYIDDELSKDEAPRVRSHVNTCHECSAFVELLVSTRKQVLHLDGIELRESFARDVAMGVRSRTTQEQEWTVIEKTAEKVLAGIAFIVIVLLGGSALLSQQDTQQESQRAGLFDLYIRDSTVSRLVTAETITREDILAAALTHDEGTNP